MKIHKNKTIAIAITLFLVTCLAIPLCNLSNANAAVTYPIPGYPNDGYDLATYTAIQQGMYFTGMDANATATRLLLWSRYHDIIPVTVFIAIAPDPVGIGQTTNFVVFNPQLPPGSSPNAGTPRYHFRIDVTSPSGIVEHYPTANQILAAQTGGNLSLIHISEPTRRTPISYAVFC